MPLQRSQSLAHFRAPEASGRYSFAMTQATVKAAAMHFIAALKVLVALVCTGKNEIFRNFGSQEWQSVKQINGFFCVAPWCMLQQHRATSRLHCDTYFVV
jgi:hypothetical protein